MSFLVGGGLAEEKKIFNGSLLWVIDWTLSLSDASVIRKQYGSHLLVGLSSSNVTPCRLGNRRSWVMSGVHTYYYLI